LILHFGNTLAKPISQNTGVHEIALLGWSFAFEQSAMRIPGATKNSAVQRTGLLRQYVILYAGARCLGCSVAAYEFRYDNVDTDVP
jgi:hypothetical protein